MRICVFSDTHGMLNRLPAALVRAGAFDAFVHLGDYASDAAEIAKQCHVPYYAVRGNCDFSTKYPSEQVAVFDEARIFLTHGHRYRDIYRLALAAEDAQCQAALFGHTHIPLVTAQGSLLIVNPGSFSEPRAASSPSFAVLTIHGKDVSAEMMSF